MSSSRGRNPETVAALLDTAWRLADGETQRTNALDRKTATIATFASILVSIAALSAGSLRVAALPDPLHATLVIALVAAICTLTSAVVVTVAALLPREFVSLGADYLDSLPTWESVRKPPEQVRGEALQGLAGSVIAERAVNDRKSRQVHVALVLLVAGVLLVAAEGLTLTLWSVAG